MAYLLDTSILVRLANTNDAQHNVATGAVLKLHRRSEVLHITPQVLIEFRNVATRPKSANGAGLSIVDAETHASTFEAKFALLAETPDIFASWKALVGALGTIGKQVHEWTKYALVLDVPETAKMIGFGMLVVGPGQAWVDDFEFAVVGRIGCFCKSWQAMRSMRRRSATA